MFEKITFLHYIQKKMSAKAGTSGDPIVTPSVCLCIELLNLNSTENVALFINSTNMSFGMTCCELS